MRRKLTKKQKENLRSHKWIVFERSWFECSKRIHELRNDEWFQNQSIEVRKRLKDTEKRIRKAFIAEYYAQGLSKYDCIIDTKCMRKKVSIEAD